MKERSQMTPLIIVFVSLILGSILFYSGRADLKNPAGINSLEQVRLGQSQQWISIRGNDLTKPVLLFLHGGPGSANLSKLRMQTPALEDYFIVVNWDQRGAGKSYHLGFDAQSLTLEQYISDAHGLTQLLKERFHVEKIYLMGFSWGTVPGLSLAARFPEDYLGYIGVGQEVDFIRAERLSLDWVRQKAVDAGNKQAISEMSSIDPAYANADWQDQLSRERKWLLNYGGVYHTAKSYNHEMKMLFTAPEYSWFEKMLWPLGSMISLKKMWPELMLFRFSDTVKQVKIPVLFISGRFDMNAAAELAEQYYQQLDAPAGKKWVWCDRAAHDVFFDEPDTLVEAIVKMSEGGTS